MQHCTPQRDIIAELHRSLKRAIYLAWLKSVPGVSFLAAKQWGEKEATLCHTGPLVEDCVVFVDKSWAGQHLLALAAIKLMRRREAKNFKAKNFRTK